MFLCSERWSEAYIYTNSGTRACERVYVCMQYVCTYMCPFTKHTFFLSDSVSDTKQSESESESDSDSDTNQSESDSDTKQSESDSDTKQSDSDSDTKQSVSDSDSPIRFLS
jgi:hypothetical protein